MPTRSEECARTWADARAPISERQPTTIAEAVELGMAVATVVSGESSSEWLAFTPARDSQDERTTVQK